MLFKTDAPVGVAISTATESRSTSPKGDAPALIGMSLRQDIPGGLLSSRARFRFSCHDHSGTEASHGQRKPSKQRGVPSRRVSRLDTAH